MKVSRFFYCVKQGLKNIIRNRTFSLASVATMTCCLFLFGVFFCLLFNFREIMASAETSVGVTTFFNDGVTEDKIMEIKTAIELRDEVESVEYVSADQAWDQFKGIYFNGEGNTEAMKNLESDNPLVGSDSLTIYLKDTSKQQELVDYLNTIPEVRRVNASKSLADSFTNFSRLLGYASLGIIVILVAVAIFLISNTVTIGITVRKEEIAIMKYIGATDMFVKGPFYVEGIVIGLVGSVIPVVYLATAEIFAHIPFNACLKRVGDARQVPAESARSLHHSRKGLAVHIEQGIVDHREVTHCMAAGRGRHRHGIKTARRHSFFLMQMVGCVFHSGSQLKRLEEALQRSAHYQGIVPAQGVAVGGVIVDSTVYGEVGVVFVALEGAGII